MYRRIEAWLNDILGQKIPSAVRAFCFNLYEDYEGWSIELMGTESFRLDDEDWACDEITDFGTREKPLSWKEEADWNEVLSEVSSALKQYLENGSCADILKSRAGVAVGFVDGNLEILYSNLSGVTQELPILTHELEYDEKIAQQSIEAKGKARGRDFDSSCMPRVHDEVLTSQNEVSKVEKSTTARRIQGFHGGFLKEICVIIASVIILVFVMIFGAIISHNKAVSNGAPQQTDDFAKENKESSAAALVEQVFAGRSETVEEPVQAETSTPKKAYQYQARDYFKDEIWELKRVSIFIHQQSGGQVYLKLNESFDSEPLYQGEELLGYYYNFTVREVRPDSTEIRNRFYVKEDLSEILCMETATGNLYDLESWRNSSEYAERMKEISNWQQEREELLFASEGQALDEPWYDAYRAIVADWTLIEDSDWSSDLDYIDYYFGQDYQFDSYWLCDIDKNGTPELFLYSDTRNMTDMVAVVTYTDRPVVVFVEMIHGVNLETAELIRNGHWHGAGGSGDEYEWTGFRIQGVTAEYSMYIDYYEFYEEDIYNHYVIYHPETDDFEEPVEGREYEEIYATHVANCIWVWNIPKYDLVDDLSGLKVVYK